MNYAGNWRDTHSVYNNRPRRRRLGRMQTLVTLTETLSGSGVEETSVWAARGAVAALQGGQGGAGGAVGLGGAAAGLAGGVAGWQGQSRGWRRHVTGHRLNRLALRKWWTDESREPFSFQCLQRQGHKSERDVQRQPPHNQPEVDGERT